jgi:hypothetical protein
VHRDLLMPAFVLGSPKRRWNNTFAELVALPFVLIGYSIRFAEWLDRATNPTGLAWKLMAIGAVTVVVAVLPELLGSWMNGLRILRQRHGVMEILPDRVVIRDRWMLRRPLHLVSSEIDSVQVIPPRPARHNSVARALAVLLPVGNTSRFPTHMPLVPGPLVPQINLAIHFSHGRHITEAVGRHRSRRQIDRANSGVLKRAFRIDGLLVSVENPDQVSRELRQWMTTAPVDAEPSRPSASRWEQYYGATAVVVAAIGVAFLAFGSLLAWVQQ